MPVARNWRHIKVGDLVTRNFFGDHQIWKVTEVSETLITCGLGWQFERDTGFEYDEDCHSGTKFGVCISYLE